MMYGKTLNECYRRSKEASTTKVDTQTSEKTASNSCISSIARSAAYVKEVS